MSELPRSIPRFPGGEYEIAGLLGSGGMAVVYRGRDPRLGRSVAIKVLRPEVAHVVGAERFQREITVASALSHPNIVPLLGSGEVASEDGRVLPYYVMPLVEGESLADRITNEKRLPIPDALRITREILDALEYAHAHGVLHRDIKPANVLLSGTHAVVTDFGLARLLPPGDRTNDSHSSITVSGFAVGTPVYMSPEQALGDREVDARTDLFSVGCVLYEMLTGVTPFDAPTGQSVIARKVNGAFVPASALRQSLPVGMDELLARALAPERSDRFASAVEFRRAIEGLETASMSGNAVAFARGPTLSRGLIAVNAGIALALAAVALLVWRSSAPEVAPPTLSAIADQSRVAVMPFEMALEDSALASVASGLSSDLIDELAQYPALTVISRNGVRGLGGAILTPDSIARRLNVGSVVIGDVQRIGDSVRVSVRLVDGASNVQVAKADAMDVLDHVLSLRASVLDSVTNFLRSAIGQQLAQRRRDRVSNADAWALVAEAQATAERELGQATRWTPAERSRRYAMLEETLVRAAALDPTWSTPYVRASSLLLTQADVETFVGFAQLPSAPRDAEDSRSRQPAPEPNELRRKALRYAELAVARDRGDADALHVRGRARMALWQAATDADDETLRAGAEADLRRAVTIRQDRAGAWSDLSQLLELSGDYSGSADAAKEAFVADAFLERPEEVAGRLAFTSLASGRLDDAREWCAHGQERFPTDPRFWGCDLTIIGWVGNTAEAIDTAWRVLSRSEARDSSNMLVTGWGTRRLLVAAVAARAGLPDSARAIIAQVRSAPASAPALLQNDYGEAYVQMLLGNHDSAIALLDRYVRARPSARSVVRSSPWFTPLREDARFTELLER